MKTRIFLIVVAACAAVLIGVLFVAARRRTVRVERGPIGVQVASRAVVVPSGGVARVPGAHDRASYPRRGS